MSAGRGQPGGCRVLALVVALALTVGACASVSRLENGGLVAFGESLEGAREPRYYLIRIDPRKRLDERTWRAQLKLSPEAPPRAIIELDPAWVARHLPAFAPPAEWPASRRRQDPALHAFQGGGFFIAFDDGQLVSVELCSHCAGGRASPRVGRPGGPFYPLPLTEAELTEVFGPPELIRRVREVTY